MAAVEGGSTAPPGLPLTPPPRLSASSSPPTVGTLLTRASAAAPPRGGRDSFSPRSSLLSRILHRGRRGGGGGFGCRLRLLPRYCSSGAAAAKEDNLAAVNEEPAPREVAAPQVVSGQQAALRESPRSSLDGGDGKDTAAAAVEEHAVPAASLGLGASLVLLLSKSAAELSRMAELRAEMERLVMDARPADVRTCSDGRPSGSDGHADSASIVKGRRPFARAGDGDGVGALSLSSDGSRTASRRDMDRMEAELEAELSRLQLQQAPSDEERASPRRDRELELQTEASSASSRSHSVICSDDGIVNDGRETDNDSDVIQDNDEEEEEDDERDAGSPTHGGVSARELERRLHELLQSRHEARIAELESALERAQRKLRETEREASRWRDTAKLATRFTDESRLR
ncbi:unnamed protein product [Urochloa decumbens]|uniref:Uncharacterized protein n=1 Tax=Urochloa decumbens TaxID=240449 RepID=A0ABC9CGQ4_9POAL